LNANKIFSLIIAILLVSSHAIAQRKSDAKKRVSTRYNKSRTSMTKSELENKKLFSNIFGGAIANFGQSPNALQYGYKKIYDPISGSEKSVKILNDATAKASYFNYLYVGVNERYIIKKTNDDQSICIELSPSLGFGLGADGAGNLEIPFSISFNKGNIATYTTKKEIGYGVGLGLQYLKLGLIATDPNDSKQYTSQYFEPILVVTYRALTENDNAREWSLKIGYGAKKPKDQYNIAGKPIDGDPINGYNDDIVAKNTFSVRLSLGYYLGY
jgi:hypothetical protein